MSIQRPHTTPPPPLPLPLPEGFDLLGAVLTNAGIVRWLKAAEARAALRALCADEPGTERERYRQETLRRAKMEAER